MRSFRRSRGFTLMELLVAVTLLSLAMTALYGLLYSTIGAWRLLDQRNNPSQKARLALTMMQRDIQSVSVRAEHLMEGDHDGITLFSVVEPMNVEEGLGTRLMRVRYRYRRAQHELVREEAMVTAALPNRPPPDKKVNPEHVELSDKMDFLIAENIEDFELRYIWSPAPEIRDTKSPPPPVEPIVVERHKENWGLPTGIEIRLILQNPEDESEQEFRQVIAFPLRRERQPEKALQKMLGSAS